MIFGFHIFFTLIFSVQNINNNNINYVDDEEPRFEDFVPKIKINFNEKATTKASTSGQILDYVYYFTRPQIKDLLNNKSKYTYYTEKPTFDANIRESTRQISKLFEPKVESAKSLKQYTNNSKSDENNIFFNNKVSQGIINVTNDAQINKENKIQEKKVLDQRSLFDKNCYMAEITSKSTVKRCSCMKTDLFTKINSKCTGSSNKITTSTMTNKFRDTTSASTSHECSRPTISNFLVNYGQYTSNQPPDFRYPFPVQYFPNYYPFTPNINDNIFTLKVTEYDITYNKKNTKRKHSKQHKSKHDKYYRDRYYDSYDHITSEEEDYDIEVERPNIDNGFKKEEDTYSTKKIIIEIGKDEEKYEINKSTQKKDEVNVCIHGSDTWPNENNAILLDKINHYIRKYNKKLKVKDCYCSSRSAFNHRWRFLYIYCLLILCYIL